MLKQVIIIRTDLKMGKGKIGSQCAHASLAAFLKAKKDPLDPVLTESSGFSIPPAIVAVVLEAIYASSRLGI